MNFTAERFFFKANGSNIEIRLASGMHTKGWRQRDAKNLSRMKLCSFFLFLWNYNIINHFPIHILYLNPPTYPSLLFIKFILLFLQTCIDSLSFHFLYCAIYVCIFLKYFYSWSHYHTHMCVNAFGSTCVSLHVSPRVCHCIHPPRVCRCIHPPRVCHCIHSLCVSLPSAPCVCHRSQFLLF